MNWRIAFVTTTILFTVTAPLLGRFGATVAIYLIAGVFSGLVVHRLENSDDI